jgi:broad specificity phosphatase PhoE
VVLRHAPDPAGRTGTGLGGGLTSREFQGVLDEALGGWLADGGGGDTYANAVRSALDDVAARLGRGETAMVFTSAGAIAAACRAVLALPAASFIPFNRVQVNTAITKLVVGAQGTSLISFNDHGHLEAADRLLVTYR